MNRKIGIIGGGIMGTGLVRWLLPRGFHVAVAEANKTLAEKFTQRLEGMLRKEMEKGSLPQEGYRACLERLNASDGVSHLQGADLVVEAAPEQFALKKDLLSRVEEVVDAGTIIASNTSAIPITALGAGLKRPERFLGTHFFNPAQVMPLVEVVPGADTSQQILDGTMTFLKSEGKKPIKIKDCPGFLVSRILGAYMNEAMWLLQEEVGILDMEAIVSDLGMPMGPITLGEMVGWDIIRASNETLRNYYGSRFEIPPLLKRLNNDKRLGIKTGRGLMDHSTRPPAATEDLVPSSRTPDDGTRVRAGRQLMGAIWAESIRCMEEGVAGAREIDAAMVMGAGFPRGPLAWADETGLEEVANLLSSLTATLGERFLPAPVLRIYAMAGYLGTKAGRGLAGSYGAPSGGEGKRGAEGA